MSGTRSQDILLFLKPMIKKILFAAAVLFSALSASAFESEGHDAIAYIAECNLTPTAKATIEKYLGGRSIVYYASWMDYIRLTPEYKHTDGWHSASLDANGKAKIWKDRYMAQVGITQELTKVRDYKHMTDSAVAVSIKLLVHMIGDMHCPAHTFFEGTPQKIHFSFKGGDKMRFHKFWDQTSLSMAHNWYYTEYQHQLDRATPQEKAEICSGTLVDWIEDNGRIVRPVYDWFTDGKDYDKYETPVLILKAAEIQHLQIMKAGYRLAHVLNSVFDPEYAKTVKTDILK